MLYEPWDQPESQTAFWERVIAEYDEACATLLSVHFETEMEAKEGKYTSPLDARDMRMDTLFVHRFRRSDDRENIQHFREMGLRLLERVGKQIDDRLVTPEFAGCWGKLMFCVGFVSVGQFATGNDAGHLRAGKGGGEKVSSDKYKQWLSPILLHFYEKNGTLTKAREEVAEYLRAVRLSSSAHESAKEYADQILGENGDLKSTYAERFGLDAIRRLAAKPDDETTPLRPPYDGP